jgi:hypothetical protein
MRAMTVAERADKNGGFIAGPDHHYLNRAMAGKQQEKPDTPPALGSAEDDEERCAVCSHFAGMRCGKYDYPVEPEQVCASFESAAAGEEE